MRWREQARGIGGLLMFLLCWELVVRGGLLHYEYLPAPSTILRAMIGMIADTGVFAELLHTVGATLIGWLCALAIGLTCGILLALNPTLQSYSITTIEILRPLPPVALVPIALLFFGFSLQTELFVIIIPSVWPVLVNTLAGLQAVPERLRDVARSMHLSRFDVVTKIMIPAASPTILVGCRLSLGIALVLAIISEMIGNPEGLGNAVVREAQALHPNLMFAYVLITGGLGMALNAAVIYGSKVWLPGQFSGPAILKPSAR